MSELLRAQRVPQFNWYPAWVKTDEKTGFPSTADKISSWLKQPDTIEVYFASDGKELEAKIVPDQGLFGVEFYLVYTLPDFQTKIIANILPESLQDDGETLFRLMERCLQGTALITWREVLKTMSDTPGFVKSKDSFIEAQKDYLESIAEMSNIGDQLIRWMRVMRKPASMSVHDFVRRRVQLFSFLDSGLLRYRLSLPSAQERAEQLFLAMPKTYQLEYARTNRVVSDNIRELADFFDNCSFFDKATANTARATKRCRR